MSTTKDAAELDLRLKVYQATQILETLADEGLISGNGHHARQKVAEMAVQELRDRWVQGPRAGEAKTGFDWTKRDPDDNYSNLDR